MGLILSRKVNTTAALAAAALLALLGALAVTASSASANHTGIPGTVPPTIPEGDDDSYGEAVCFVNGAAGTATSPVDSVAHDQADDDEAFDPGTNLNDTDGGTFNFMSDTVACAGADEGGEVIGTVVGAPLVNPFTIEAGQGAGFSRLQEAEYTNLVCGTGHAEGSADLFSGPLAPAAHDTDLKTRFAIDFVGGIGPLAITSFEGYVGLDPATAQVGPPPNDVDTPPVDLRQDVDTGHGTGVVHIAPFAATTEQPGNPPNPDGNPDPGDTGDPGDPTPPPGTAPEPCVNGGVIEFRVNAAFEATLSGDTDVANDENDDGPDVP